MGCLEYLEKGSCRKAEASVLHILREEIAK